MFDNNSVLSADESLLVSGDSAALRDPYGLDFNKDGHSDLVWHDPVSGQNVLWLMAGDQVSDRIDLPSEAGWTVEAIADFNRDGQADLLVRNKSTGDNAAWFMGGENGAEYKGRDGITGIGADWEVQGVSDFDDDAKADILWQNKRTGENVIWYMGDNSGTAVRDRAELRSPSRQWSAQGLADFDGDGRTDVLWRNKDSGENLVWYMHGDQGTRYKDSERIETFKDSDWQLHGVGDFNQNGSLDLFWRKQSSGDNVIWQMEGEKNNRIEERIQFANLKGSWLPIIGEWSPAIESDQSTNSSNSASESSSPAPLPTQPASSSADNGFNIEFDYRFDINNWFDDEKKAVLEAAADIWEAIILDEFENIKIGTTVHATDPYGNGLTSFQLDSEIDDIKVFAFAQDLNATRSLAEAGATVYQGDRNTSTVFQPWLGEIVFNDKEAWYVNADTSETLDIPSTQADMLSVAVHELGHILGISSGIEAFSALIENGAFTGEAAIALNDGEPIPLDGRGSHIEDNFEIPGLGENSLDPNIQKGTRKLLTALDVALLDDIGYSVDYSTVAAVPEIEVLSIQEGNQDKTTLRANNSYTVRWEDNFAADVKIELYEGNRFVRTIVDSTPSDGEFTWYVTTDLISDAYYSLRISSAEDSDVFDISGRPFQIEASPYINIDTPSDNAPLLTGSTFELTWSDNLDETVRIELYKDGSYERTITASTSSDGSYQWQIPTYLDTSRNYHLRFTSTSESSVYDESALFWIQKA